MLEGRSIDPFKDPISLGRLYAILISYKIHATEENKRIYDQEGLLGDFEHTNMFLEEIERRLPAIRRNKDE